MITEGTWLKAKGFVSIDADWIRLAKNIFILPPAERTFAFRMGSPAESGSANPGQTAAVASRSPSPESGLWRG